VRVAVTRIAVVAIAFVAASGCASSRSHSLAEATTSAARPQTTRTSGPIFEYRASDNLMMSDLFKVPNRWAIDWTYSCSASDATSGVSGIAIQTLDASGQLDMKNLGFGTPQNRPRDSGTARFPVGGVERLRVISQCAWTVSVHP
jgi:hypothetical protein